MDPMSAILCLTKHRDLKHLGVKPYQRFPPNQAANPTAAVAMQPTRFLLKRSVWKGKLYQILSSIPNLNPLTISSRAQHRPVSPQRNTCRRKPGISPRKATLLTHAQQPSDRPPRGRKEGAAYPHAGALRDDPAQLRGAQVPGVQRQGVPRCRDKGGDGGAQAGRVLPDQEAIHLGQINEIERMS